MHPYTNQPDRSFWRRFVSDTRWSALDFVGQPKFTLAPEARVSAAGSCFAQHINRHMRMRGLSPFQSEHANTLVANDAAEVASYTAFSARYGNIYSSRQCLELFQQAFGERPVVEDFVEQDGRYYDLLRPNAIPAGFASREEAQADRHFHLARVRQMFEQSDAFIFTLGLTEIWQNVHSGHCYPVCPGTARGQYLAETHQFHNLTHTEVVADLSALVVGLRRYNPALKLIFTVSPVPLVATHTTNNVLTASVYSKSVLRGACGEVADQLEQVQYFPSYEIVSHVASFGQYLQSDLREISERGVGHVMQCFFDAFYPRSDATPAVAGPALVAPGPALVSGPDIEGLLQANCEELFNAPKGR